MGRFDALTQLDENQAPVKKLDTAPVVSGKKHSPLSLPDKPIRQRAQNKEAKQKVSPSPVSPSEANTRPVRPRHAFDIYQDQYEALLELSLEERREGGTGSMSAMVREALDKFITERKKH